MSQVRNTLGLVLVWCDLETTGLDPERHSILEISTVVTDDALETIIIGPQLVVQASGSALAQMDPFVVDMHKSNGLLIDVKQSKLTLFDAVEQTIDFFQAQGLTPGDPVLAGSGIDFDRRFLEWHAPALSKWFNPRRKVDVATVRTLGRLWNPQVQADAPPNPGTHRATDDILRSIEELRFYRRQLFVDKTLVGGFTAGAPGDASVSDSGQNAVDKAAAVVSRPV